VLNEKCLTSETATVGCFQSWDLEKSQGFINVNFSCKWSELHLCQGFSNANDCFQLSVKNTNWNTLNYFLWKNCKPEPLARLYEPPILPHSNRNWVLFRRLNLLFPISAPHKDVTIQQFLTSSFRESWTTASEYKRDFDFSQRIKHIELFEESKKK